MNMKKSITKKTTVSDFLVTAKKHPISNKQINRLILGIDATASREATWDIATSLHSDIFSVAEKTLQIQLAYYRGIGDFKASEWTQSPQSLRSTMEKVQCLGGRTQISRFLQHCYTEALNNTLKGIVFIGDCCEEEPKEIIELAGKIGILGIPIFVFQEGNDAFANTVFRQIAKISRGAHSPFSVDSAKTLAELLEAVISYVVRGHRPTNDLLKNPHARYLLDQIDP